MGRTAWSAAVPAAALVVVAAAAAQQTGPPQPPPVIIESMAGVDSYELYCAACHGRGGQGDGPVAPALRTPPPDLTRLSQRGGGAFPAERVRDVITGAERQIEAHGTTEMPVWGTMFRAFESDARTRARIDSLVEYLESIQLPATGPQDPGRQLFLTYCASCHGADARGDGPMAVRLRQVPPDLTQFAARNAGVFPSVRVARIIDGRDVASHGTREMPVWGDAFRASAAGRSEASVKERVDAITRYLQAIQERLAGMPPAQHLTPPPGGAETSITRTARGSSGSTGR
jgi:mono/diheme cytochrome c family protein